MAEEVKKTAAKKASTAKAAPKKAAAPKAEAKVEAPKKSEEVILLEQIRDELKKRK